MIRDLATLHSVATAFFGGRRGLLITGALLSAAAMLFGVGLLGLSGWFITATAIAGMSTATALAFDVFAPAAGIRLFALGRTGARYGERLVTHEAALRIIATLREQLFRGWAGAGSLQAMTMRPARTLFRLTLDTDALDSLYLRIVVPLVAALAAIAFAVVSFGLIEPLLGVMAGIFLMLTGLGIPLVMASGARRLARRRAYVMEVLRSRIVDLVSGQVELVMAGRLNAQCESIVAADGRLADADNQLNRIEARASAAFGIASAAMLAAALVAVAAFAQVGSISAPIAIFGIFVALAVMEPFLALRRGAVEFTRTALAARRIAPRLKIERPSRVNQTPAAGFSVWIDRASACYPDSASCALIDLSLAVRSGERVAVTGKSGAGKSTLLALMAGEIACANGVLRACESTRLTQRTELFRDSLRENLLLAAPSATDRELFAALAAAGLANDIGHLPHGLATRLGEGGLGLSGGQARRLTLARLLLRNAPLWLLDEPTEGLDGTTARDVLRRLAAQAEGHTLVIASHLRREAELADLIVTIDRGRIVETARRGEAAFDVTLARLRPD